MAQKRKVIPIVTAVVGWSGFTPILGHERLSYAGWDASIAPLSICVKTVWTSPNWSRTLAPYRDGQEVVQDAFFPSRMVFCRMIWGPGRCMGCKMGFIARFCAEVPCPRPSDCIYCRRLNVRLVASQSWTGTGVSSAGWEIFARPACVQHYGRH